MKLSPAGHKQHYNVTRGSLLCLFSLSDLEGKIVARREGKKQFLTMPEVLDFQKGHSPVLDLAGRSVLVSQSQRSCI